MLLSIAEGGRSEKGTHAPMVSRVSDSVTLKVPRISAREDLTRILRPLIDCHGSTPVSSVCSGQLSNYAHINDDLG
jgi:hypothetical protein